MSNILTLRVSPAKLAELDRAAAAVGRDRSGYVRQLIEHALSQKGRRARHKFASADLLGSLSLGIGPATNKTIRHLIRQRLRGRHETHR
jgi:uncharacterized protein (DUF1778 family)